jgi:hypothetical protein
VSEQVSKQVSVKPTPPPPEPTTAVGIASLAAKIVGGDRNRQHGDKLQNFLNIASLWSGWLELRFGVKADEVSAHDVAIMMVLMKAARTMSGTTNIDDYVDMAGYAACAGEVKLKEDQ